MVYSKIDIIVGIAYTTEKELLDVIRKYEEEDVYDEILKISDDFKNREFQIFNSVCCSKNPTFLIGKIISTIWRKDNECIGITEAGYYDVEKILHNLTECPINQICERCRFDNTDILSDRCKRCAFDIKDHKLDKIPDNWIPDELKEDKISLYYRLDDCLYCT